MAFLLENAYNGSALVADAANHPNIRLFTSKKTSSKVPLLEQPVRKPCTFVEPFYTENDHFTKTGSGQRSEKSGKSEIFRRW